MWQKMGELMGKNFQGFALKLVPGYYVGEDGASVHITASSADAAGIFEHLKIYVNGQLVAEGDDVDFLETDVDIDETSVVRAEATILGLDYTEMDTIIHYASFWLGSGASYQDIMDNAHLIPITNGMRGAYDLHCEDGDHIIIIVGKKIRDGFFRGDINGFEIPMNEEIITINDLEYCVFTSKNTYVEGTYNVDING